MLSICNFSHAEPCQDCKPVSPIQAGFTGQIHRRLRRKSST